MLNDRRLGNEVWDAWVSAYVVHAMVMECEAVDVDTVLARLPVIEALIREVRRLLDVRSWCCVFVGLPALFVSWC